MKRRVYPAKREAVFENWESRQWKPVRIMP
jgi:hypothetical protein